MVQTSGILLPEMLVSLLAYCSFKHAYGVGRETEGINSSSQNIYIRNSLVSCPYPQKEKNVLVFLKPTRGIFSESQ